MPDLLTKLAENAIRLADHPALVSDCANPSHRVLTWGELARRIDGWVAGFRERGRQPGDRVGIAHYSGTMGIELYLATQAAGLQPVLLGIGLREQLPSAARTLHLTELFTGLEQATASSELERSGVAVWVSATDEDPFIRAAGSGNRDWIAARADETVSAIQYSTGTTGAPKGIVRSVSSDYYDAVNRCLGMRAREAERWVCASPENINVAIGATRCMTLMGGTIIALDDVSPTSIETNTRDGVTILPLQAPGWRELLDSGIADQLPSRGLRVCVSTGQRTPRKTLNQLRQLMDRRGEVVNSYGLTETSTLAILTSTMSGYETPLNVGRPSALTRIEVVSPSESLADSRGAGEIRVQGPAVFPGYLAGEAALPPAERGDGWFYTGDVGRWGAEGDLCVLGRWADAFVHQGRYVFPYEVECLVNELDGVLDAVLVAGSQQAPSDVELVPVLVVQLTPTATVSADEVLSAVSDVDLGPLRMMVIDALPRNRSRKVNRSALAELLHTSSPSLRSWGGEPRDLL